MPNSVLAACCSAQTAPSPRPASPGQLIDRLQCTQAEREQILAGSAQRLLRPGTRLSGQA